MKKILFACCFFLISANVFGQQFSQYNTGTVYDSFENPAQRAFIPDTTKQFAFNFLIPNFNANFYLTGNTQVPLKSRVFNSYYNTAGLQVGKGNYNHFNVNANAYSIMFKMFASLSGNQEVGFFTNTSVEARGAMTDETVALFNGYQNFPKTTYDNVFNDHYFYQAYNQIGLTYREQVTKQFAFGVKLSALSGLGYEKVNINQSRITFDKAIDQDNATLYLKGIERTSGDLNSTTMLDKTGFGFQNPGAAISIGTSYTNEDGYHMQYNLKNVGFIHWTRNARTANFDDYTVIEGLSSPERETNIKDALKDITHGSLAKHGFTTPTNGLLEVSVNKSYWLGDEQEFKFSPTLIASKEMFYSGFTGALVAPIEYKKYTVSLTSSYNDLKLLNIGGQFMIKSTNSDFFIGTESLYQTASLIKSGIESGSSNQTQYFAGHGAFSGMNFFLGVSFRFGTIIESRMNESSTPDGDKGFVGKLWEKMFNKKDKNY